MAPSGDGIRRVEPAAALVAPILVERLAGILRASTYISQRKRSFSIVSICVGESVRERVCKCCVCVCVFCVCVCVTCCMCVCVLCVCA